MENETARPSKTGLTPYLECEKWQIYALLMTAGGCFGAFTYSIRGGVFCNAQTGNFVLLAMSLGNGDWSQALYYLIPISAYCLGAFVSEAAEEKIGKLHLIRWETLLVLLEMLAALFLGFLPETAPVQITQVLINFICSMQYNTFRQAQGIPMATTFCTNHIRQVGVGLAKVVRKKDPTALRRGLIHAVMVFAFFAGAALLTFLCPILAEMAVWVPMGIVLVKLIRADLGAEHDCWTESPPGIRGLHSHHRLHIFFRERVQEFLVPVLLLGEVRRYLHFPFVQHLPCDAHGGIVPGFIIVQAEDDFL